MESIGLLKVISDGGVGPRVEIIQVLGFEINPTQDGKYVLVVKTINNCQIRLHIFDDINGAISKLDILVSKLKRTKDSDEIFIYIQDQGLTSIEKFATKAVEQIERKHNFGKTNMFEK